ncbi:c-type cytochrome [Primorskyibacter sp. S187A]|uniref:c-type cytochrome n=1 Tax=Primorskyibacter sp. S187A TaxID=3415130 RepID=UPI003C7D2C8E
MKLATCAATLALPMMLCTPAIASEAFDKIKISAGQALYDQSCHRCHSDNASDASYGPPLTNILYRAAGSVEDYDYSIALEASGIVWTPAALRAWMEDNKGFMPGTKMRHVGIEDRTVQDFILAYLESISDAERNKSID